MAVVFFPASNTMKGFQMNDSFSTLNVQSLHPNEIFVNTLPINGDGNDAEYVHYITDKPFSFLSGPCDTVLPFSSLTNPYTFSHNLPK